jgi:hypothetical protein
MPVNTHFSMGPKIITGAAQLAFWRRPRAADHDGEGFWS